MKPRSEERLVAFGARDGRYAFEAGNGRLVSQQETLQIVVEIVGDLVHQVYSPAAHDVVL